MDWINRCTCGRGWQWDWGRAMRWSIQSWWPRPSKLLADPCPRRGRKCCATTRWRTSVAKSTKCNASRWACPPWATGRRSATGSGRSCPAPSGWRTSLRRKGSTPGILRQTKWMKFFQIKIVYSSTVANVKTIAFSPEADVWNRQRGSLNQTDVAPYWTCSYQTSGRRNVTKRAKPSVTTRTLTTDLISHTQTSRFILFSRRIQVQH